MDKKQFRLNGGRFLEFSQYNNHEYDDFSDVYDFDGNLVFQFADNSTLLKNFYPFDSIKKRAIVELIKSNKFIHNFIKLNFDSSLFSVQNAHILYDNKDFIIVRGWGHLTGIGGLNLSENNAKEIQDKLINHILKCFKDVC